MDAEMSRYISHGISKEFSSIANPFYSGSKRTSSELPLYIRMAVTWLLSSSIRDNRACPNALCCTLHISQ